MNASRVIFSKNYTTLLIGIERFKHPCAVYNLMREDIRKKLRKEFEELLDEDEDSDIPVSERKVKDKKIREFDE